MRSPSTGRVEVPFSARFHFARTGRNPGGTPVEGLRMVRPQPASDLMSMAGSGEPPRVAFSHAPVMVDEVVALLKVVPPGVVLDATVGAGGHARALLDAAPQVTLLGLDQDPQAVRAASTALHRYGDRARVAAGRFDQLETLLDAEGVGQLSGALFDLGVSSPQLDTAERGFSYRQPGPLDMRMDPTRPYSARDVVNEWSADDLARLFAENGEARFARRIARAIVATRPLATTTDLAEVIRHAIPAAARRTGGHPARRVFQAIRIAVNQELAILPGAIDAALERLVVGGRGVVLSYHSGEDRIVKDRFLAAATGGCVCPPGLPCVCGAEPWARLLNRGARRPSPGEVERNPRAESARLRAVERTAPGPVTPTGAAR
jgi:16S rRNA (cytosine1402-N4)-methyltransferase